MLLFILGVVVIGFLLYRLQESDVWESTLFKVIRWLLFIPISFIIIGFILSIPNIVLNMIYDLAWWQILIILVFAIGILTLFFQATIYFGTEMILNLCPHKKVGAVFTIFISLIVSTSYIVYVWTEGSSYAINYRSDFHSIGVTVFNLILLGFIIFNSIDYFNAPKENENNFYKFF